MFSYKLIPGVFCFFLAGFAIIFQSILLAVRAFFKLHFAFFVFKYSGSGNLEYSSKRFLP